MRDGGAELDDEQVAPRPWRQWLVIPVVFIASVALQLARQAGRHSWNTVWAEDGMYAGDALREPAASILFRGYSGYAQVSTRLLALGVRIVPPERIASYLAVTAAVASSLLALFVYRCTDGWIRHRSLRITMAAMCVVAPVLGSENTANITNTLWTLAFAGFWAVVAQVRRPADVVARVGVAFVGMLSTPVTALFLPLSLAVTLVRRRTTDAAVLIALLVGGTIQSVVMLSADRGPDPTSSSLGNLPTTYGARVLGSLLVGERGLGRAWEAIGVWTAGLAIVLCAVLFAAALRSSTRVQRPFAIAAVLCSLLAFAAPTWLRGLDVLRSSLAEQPVPGGARYAVLPLLLAVAAALALLDRLRTNTWRRLFVAHAAVLCALNFSVTITRSTGPSWSSTVVVAKEQCRLEAVSDVELPISPPGSSMLVPCARLTG
jgi:hypothetical protein